MHSLWWNYVNELLYVFKWFRILQKTQQFNHFDFRKIFTNHHSIAIDIKSLNVIWTLNLINRCHTTMHHDFEKSKSFWMFSEFDYFRLLFLKISTNQQIEFHNRMKNKFRFTHKSVKKKFVLYVLINDKDILHDFMLKNFAIISKFIIAMQYNFYMNYVNRANQLRNELTISRFEQVK